MSRVAGLRCDRCGLVVDGPPVELPPGWVAIEWREGVTPTEKVNVSAMSTTIDLCEACGAKMANAIAKVMGRRFVVSS